MNARKWTLVVAVLALLGPLVGSAHATLGQGARFTWTRSADPQSTFDTVKALHFGYAMVDPDPVQMQKVAAAGLRIVLWGGNYTDPPGCTWVWNDATFDAKMSAAKNSIYGALVDYVFVADEPHGPGSGAQGCPNAPADVTARSNRSKTFFPLAKTLVSENKHADWPYLVNAADIFLPIIYPCKWTSTSCDQQKIINDVAELRSYHPNQWWVTIQSFSEPCIESDGSACEPGDTPINGAYYRAPSLSEQWGMYGQYHSLVDTDPKVTGWWNYTFGHTCCGNDVGFGDASLTYLQPGIKTENGG